MREYEPQFWLHDIYVGTSQENILADLYFRSKISRLRGRGQSYGGYEKNRLYLNRQGERFVEVGHLFGLALEQDSRNVVADDLDGDGRMDLLVTTFEVWPQVKQTLQIFRNHTPKAGNWIGFRLREEGQGFSPVGATIRLHLEDRTLIHQIITGDGYRTQSANKAHFGLGRENQVRQAEIRWANGETLLLDHPGINQWHEVRAR